MSNQQLSLRETKSARAKINLMRAFMQMLKTKAFEQISIKEVCRMAEVSEPTFFNYFPEKRDVVAYHLQLLTKKIIGQAVIYSPEGNSIQLINNIFSLMAKELTNPHEVYPMLAVMLNEKEKLKNVPVSSFEMELAFADYKEEGDAHKVPSIHMDAFIAQTVKQAIKDGQFPADTKAQEVSVSLISILIGTLFAVRFSQAQECAIHYKRQLKTLWKSLGVKG